MWSVCGRSGLSEAHVVAPFVALLVMVSVFAAAAAVPNGADGAFTEPEGATHLTGADLCPYADLDWVPEGPLPFDAGGDDAAAFDAVVPELDDLTCRGIRPGTRILTPLGICTLAFIHTDEERLYATTAGHCVNGPGDRIVVSGLPVGTVVASHYSGVGRDIAVILIDAAHEHRVDPRMCFWHGPSSLHTTAITGTPLLQTGHVVGWDGIVTRPRAGVGGGIGPTVFYWNSPTAPGDSGSAVQTWGGGALGIHTHTAIGIVGFKAGTRLVGGLDLVDMGHLQLVTGDGTWISPSDATFEDLVGTSGASEGGVPVPLLARVPQAT